MSFQRSRPRRFGIVGASWPTPKHLPPALRRSEFAFAGYREISLNRLRGSYAYVANPRATVRYEPRAEAMVACKALHTF
jgi:hypothetical protein